MLRQRPASVRKFVHAQIFGTAYQAPLGIRGPLGNTRRGVELIHLTAKSPPISVGVVSLKQQTLDVVQNKLDSYSWLFRNKKLKDK